MRNYKYFEYSFFQEKQRDDDLSGKELINNFNLLIKAHNNNSLDSLKIIYLPSFYATPSGLYVLVGLSLFLILAIFLLTFYSEKSLPGTFIFSLLLIFQLIAKRKRELDSSESDTQSEKNIETDLSSIDSDDSQKTKELKQKNIKKGKEIIINNNIQKEELDIKQTQI